MLFVDGSQEACCSLVSLRLEGDDGHVECRLVTGKTQVTRGVKMTISRMWLVAAVNSVRLARRVKELLKIPLEGVRYFTELSWEWRTESKNILSLWVPKSAGQKSTVT
jgi:hypothetical protein